MWYLPSVMVGPFPWALGPLYHMESEGKWNQILYCGLTQKEYTATVINRPFAGMGEIGPTEDTFSC